MLKSNAPTQLTVAFASGAGAGPINAIPIPASSTAGAASWTTGFTAVNMEPIGSGGIPPFGADFNGLFNALSNAQIWEQAGYLYPYSSAFSTAVGGYPAGASLQMSSGLGLWLNQADSNTTNPDASTSANWIELCANAGGTTIALSGSSVTPTANQLGAPLLILTGALSAACKLVLPLRKGASWKILNNTTGGQTVTVGGATGSTVTIAAGSTGAQEVFTDGTNFFTTSFNGAGVYLPINGNAVSASAWVTARSITMTGDVSWSVTMDGSANVSAAGTIANGAVSLAKMANLTANTLLGNPTGAAATPVAIPLVNGIIFNSGSLGLGAITPASINTSGSLAAGTMTISGNATINGTMTAQAGAFNAVGTEVDVFLKFNNSPSRQIYFSAGASGLGINYTDTSGNFAGQGLAMNGTNGQITIGNLNVGGSGFACASLAYFSSALRVTGNTSPAASGQGSYITWNRGTASSNGEADYISHKGGGTGGHAFWNTDGSTYTLLAELTSTGVLRAIPNAANPATPYSFGLRTEGGFGGGVYINDSAGAQSYGLYTSGGTFNIASGAINGGALTARWTLDSSGNVAQTGTNNNQTSDARVKANFVSREPQPVHRAWWGDYDRTDTGAHGIGHKAQDVQITHPHRVHVHHEWTVPTGEPMLLLDRLGLAEEQGLWCGRQIDKLEARLEALEQRQVVH